MAQQTGFDFSIEKAAANHSYLAPRTTKAMRHCLTRLVAQSRCSFCAATRTFLWRSKQPLRDMAYALSASTVLYVQRRFLPSSQNPLSLTGRLVPVRSLAIPSLYILDSHCSDSHFSIKLLPCAFSTIRANVHARSNHAHRRMITITSGTAMHKHYATKRRRSPAP